MKDVDKRPGLGQPEGYQIKVQGRLTENWSDWFSGMTIVCESRSDGAPITTLTGAMADQSALRGLLDRVWDLNLTLISVIPVEISSTDEV